MRPNTLMPIMIFMTRYYKTPSYTRRINSVTQHFYRIFQFTFMSMFLVVASSCQKEVLKMGEDLLPASDFVGIKSLDTLSVFSYTWLDDSIKTSQPTYSYLGQEYDPYFGSSSAGFVSQIRLSRKWDGLPFTVDSMKLYLHILSTKGSGTDALHSISIYEIADQIYKDSSYYSKTPLNLTQFRVTNIPLPAILRTDTIINMEIKLPDNGVTLGNYIIRDTTKLFYSNTTTDFRAYFKGLYFQMDPSSDPLVLSLSLLYDQSTYYNFFILFGHDADGVYKDYSFNLDAKSINAYYNRFTHDYSTAITGDKMVHKNTTYRDTLSFLQGLNGVYTKFYFPGLAKLKSDAILGKVAINKAKLVVPFKFRSSGTNWYKNSLPSLLSLRYKTKSGTRYDVPDYSIGYDASTSPYSHPFFDGQLDSVNFVYNFNIPAFVQAYLNDATGQVEPEVEIYQSTTNKDIVFGTNKSKIPVKFEFTYTKF